jgi:hypothetical protein
MPFSTLSRLVRRLFRALSSRPISKPTFKPSLDALDQRDVPALLTWTDATGDNQFNDPYNWVSTDGLIRIPAAGDDILFTNGAGANGPGGQSGGLMGAGGPSGGSPGPCYGMQSDPNGPYNSITLTTGFTGTVTVTGPVQTDALYVNNGTIDQPTTSAGSDITVLGGATPTSYTWWLYPGWEGGSDFNWTGGTINSTTSGATLHITGSSTIAVIDPLNAGAVSTGDTISVEHSATANFMGGIVTFTGGLGISITGHSTVNVMATTEQPGVGTTTFGVTTQDGVQSINDIAGFYRVNGPVAAISEMPIFIRRGELSITGGATATFQGETSLNLYGLQVPTGSVYNKGGKVLIETGSTLVPVNGMIQMGGRLQIDVIGAKGGNAKLKGNLWVNGGSVTFLYSRALNGVPGAAEATFTVNGDVSWSGGIYTPTVDRQQPRDASKWIVRGTMTISGSAALRPIFINRGNAAPPGSKWLVIYAEGGIDGMPIFNNDGFALVGDGNTPTKSLTIVI